MSTPAILVHFPDGSREFRFPSKPLEPGDKLWHDGERYTVIHVTEDPDHPSVTVELDATDLGDVLDSERGGIVLEPVE